MRATRRGLMLAGLASLSAPALAQPAWPSGPVRIIVPFPPGGSMDTITRLLQPRLAADLGQRAILHLVPSGVDDDDLHVCIAPAMRGFQGVSRHVRLGQRKGRTAGANLEAHAPAMARRLRIGKTGPSCAP